MPPLFEGSALYMPTSLPGIAIEQAKSLLQKQDAILRTFPEVESVFGTIGRSDSATDNAPLDMYDTTLMLKPREQWRPGMTYTKLIQEMDEKVQFPGLANTWTSPVENRLDMELTGIKTPLGLKVQGPSVDGIEQLASKMQTVLSSMPQVRSIFAERISQGFYVNVEVNRTEAARYGLSVADVQTAVSSGIGGQNIAENIEGRERYPINVRYSQDFRDSVDQMRNVLIATPSGTQIPLGQVAQVSFSHGPAMIRDEDGQLTGYVYIDLKSTNYGGFVDEANRKLKSQIAIPAGYGYKWSGEYEFELRAKQRLKLILPIVFFMIFLLLYMVFNSVAEAVVLIVPTIYAMTGGLLLQWLLGYNFSVAVWVGYIALFGIAVETGVVMVVYLHESLERRLLQGNIHSNADIEDAVIEGAVKRLRPKLMTVVAVLASLAPILWESGIGSDVMKPIAAPIVGGMITSTIHVLILVPVFFVMMKERALRKGTLHPSNHNWSHGTVSGPTSTAVISKLKENLMRFNSLSFVASGLLLTASLAVAQATHTLTGTVSDAMCGKKHMMAGKSAAECTRSALKRGPTMLSWSEIRSTHSKVTRLRSTNSRRLQRPSSKERRTAPS